MILEDNLVGPTTSPEEEPEPSFEAKSAAALDNAGIQVDKQLCAAQTQVATVHNMVAQTDDIMYKVELGADEPDKGLVAPPTPLPIPEIAGCGAGSYPTRSCRSVLGNLPYDRCLQFLQTSGMLNDVEHDQDSKLVTQSEDEMAVMKYILTKYNLKADLRHFGEKGIATAKGELTQLHVMYTWVPKDPIMLSRAEKVKDLASLIFLKEKRGGKVKVR